MYEKRINAKKWITIYSFVCLISFIFFLPFYLVLNNAYENSSYSTIVNDQKTKNAIYGTSLNQNTFSYKLELIKQTKPNIVAMGSSRVMQFREIFFDKTFVTAGGGMNNLEEGVMFLEKMLKGHTPEKVILGLDFWWFSKEKENNIDFNYHKNEGVTLTKRKIFYPISLIKDKIFTYEQFFRITFGNTINDITHYENFGYQAIKSSNGFRKDGSYLYGKQLFLSKTKDISFKDTLERINKGTNGFEHNQIFSNKAVLELEQIIKLLKKNKIEYIIILPPLPQIIIEEINKNMDKYQYTLFLKEYLSKKKKFINYEDFFYDECEFIDGFHGGDVIYARIVQNLEKEGFLLLSEDKKMELHKYIEDNKSHATIKSTFYKMKEQDFLKLNCKKN